MKLIRPGLYKSDVSDPMFGATIILLRGTLDALTEELRSIEPSLDGYRGRRSRGKSIVHEQPDGGRAWSLWFPETVEVSVVVHEITHTTIDVLRYYGVRLAEGGESDETYTYFAQRLFERVWAELFSTNHEKAKRRGRKVPRRTRSC